MFLVPCFGMMLKRLWDEVEMNEEKAPLCRLIQPMSCPILAGRTDQTNSKLWNSVRQEFSGGDCGQIVFSKKEISEYVEDKKDFEDTFEFGKDEISGRAFWPHSLANYALALDPAQKPVYGPKYIFNDRGTSDIHMVQFLMYISINGKYICPDPKQENSFVQTNFVGANEPRYTEYRQGSCVDFWSFNQTKGLHILRNNVSNSRDRWEMAGSRFRAYCMERLKANNSYKVQVELRYRVLAMPCSSIRALFPYEATPVSLILSKGSFTLVMPSEGSSPPEPVFGDLVSPLAGSMSPHILRELEEEVIKLLEISPEWGRRKSKTEQPIAVCIQSDWYLCNSKSFSLSDDGTVIEEPSEWGVDCKVFFYRSPLSGWEREAIAVFDLTAKTREQQSPQPKPPFWSVSVGRSHTMEVNLLPISLLKKIENRCPPHLRDGVM